MLRKNIVALFSEKTFLHHWRWVSARFRAFKYFDIYINDLPLISKLFSILFADDTNLSDSSSSVDKLISAFKLKFELVLEWCKSNRLFINWKKTQAMFIHSKKSIILPNFISIGNHNVEVVHNFKLLGVKIDDSLNFNNFIKETIKAVNAKLYSFKKLYYLSKNVKSHFSKHSFNRIFNIVLH